LTSRLIESFRRVELDKRIARVYSWRVGYRKEELEGHRKEMALTSKGLEVRVNEK
jgi:hypothetical protein